VLLKSNISQARELARWAQEQDMEIRFVVGEMRQRFLNEEFEKEFLGPADREELIAFLEEMAEDFSLRNPSSLRYKELIGMYRDGKTRSLPCYYELSGVLLGYDGSLFYCSHSKPIGNCLQKSAYEIFFDPDNLSYRKSRLKGKECLSCPPYTLTRLELQADIPQVVGQLVSSRLRRWIRNRR
jgi:hypothetical protein